MIIALGLYLGRLSRHHWLVNQKYLGTLDCLITSCFDDNMLMISPRSSIRLQPHGLVLCRLRYVSGRARHLQRGPCHYSFHWLWHWRKYTYRYDNMSGVFASGMHEPLEQNGRGSNDQQNRRFLLALLSIFQPIGVVIASGIAYGCKASFFIKLPCMVIRTLERGMSREEV